MLAEPADPPILVEMWPGGAAASWSGLAGATGLPTTALDPGRARCVAHKHHPCALPLLQVCILYHSLYINTHTSLAVLIQEEMRSEERKKEALLKGARTEKRGYT